MVLSSFVLVLVSHAFLVQNRLYSTQTIRTATQDNVRASTDLVAREVRNAMSAGIVVAGARTLTVRSPLAVAVVCNRPASSLHDVFNEGGEISLHTDEVAGVALRDTTTGAWTAANSTWASLNASSGNPANECEANGADTVGAYGDFHRLAGLDGLLSPTPDAGDVVTLFRETTFTIETSQMDPATLGLFRAEYGDAAVEFATGIDTTAQFQYRTVGGGYVDTVAASSLASIDAVRLVADARRAPPTGGVDDITFGWTVTVPLRNVR